MSRHAIVETDISEKLDVYLENGALAGNRISDLLTAVMVYCDGSAKALGMEEVDNWFSLIISFIPDLCSLKNIWYEGDWDYDENEYAKFLMDAPQMLLSKTEFIKTIRQINHKWTEIEVVTNSVIKLNESFKFSQLKETWWYSGVETGKEISALENTLRQAMALGAKKVRIKLE